MKELCDYKGNKFEYVLPSGSVVHIAREPATDWAIQVLVNGVMVGHWGSSLLIDDPEKQWCSRKKEFEGKHAEVSNFIAASLLFWYEQKFRNFVK